MLSERQKEILNILMKEGVIKISQLVGKLNITHPTLYKELEELRGLRLEKKWGEVKLVSVNDKLEGTKIWKNFQLNKILKEELAEYVVTNLIRTKTIFLDCGTTSLFVADKIIEYGMTDLSIITVNPLIIQKFFEANVNYDLKVIGGTLNRDSAALIGTITEKALENIKADTLILGVDGVTDEGELKISNDSEIKQKKLMIKNSEQVIIPVDSSKLEKVGGVTIASLQEFKTENKNFILIIGVESSKEVTIEKSCRELERFGKNHIKIVKVKME